MNNVIKQIRKIMGDRDSSVLKIEIWTDKEIVFNIYESEIPIMVDGKKKEVYIECEWLLTQKLCGDMLIELGEISKILEENIEVILNAVKIN